MTLRSLPPTALTTKWFWIGILSGLLVAVCLRLWHLNSLPPSLYWEEAALGYDAYSLLQTGKDHHGHTWPIVALESFGDYKPALYVYAIMPFIPLVGLTSWAVRLPAALAGSISIGTIGCLAWLLTPKQWRRWASLVAVWVAAVSPWGIMFSRAGWEVNLATMLITLGMTTGIAAARSKTKISWGLMVGATILLILSTYTYHAARLIAPLLGVALALTWWREGRRQLGAWVLVGGVALLLMLPLLRALGSPATGQRWAETSLFADGKIVTESNLRRAEQPGLLSYVLYHRYVLASREVAKAYLSHFHPTFLFVRGDANARHSTQFMGQLYHIEALLLLLGIWFWFRQRTPGQWLLGWWLLVGIFPAAITTGAPHALRILPTWPVWMVVVSWGVLGGWLVLSQLVAARLPRSLRSWLPWVYGVVVVGIYLTEWLFFWRFYTTAYPRQYSQDWQYGYQQMIASVNQAEQLYPSAPVYITREYGRPAMYYWFFSQTDPRVVQQWNDVAKKDQGEYLTFDRVTFINTTAEASKGVIATSPEGLAALETRKTGSITTLATITSPTGQPIWMVVYYE